MQKPRALVVDDEAVVRRLCGRILQGLGYQTVTKSHGLEALNAAEEEPFELVITDLRMPDLDGIQLLKSIKKTSPTTDVIVITGYATLDSAIEAMKEGAIDYVRKPFSADELQMVVQACRKRRQLTEERSELQEMMGIYDLSTALNSSILLHEIVTLLLDLTTCFLKSSKALLFLMEDNRQYLYAEGCKGLPDQEYRGLRMGLNESSFSEALSRGKPAFLEANPDDPLFLTLSAKGENPKGLFCAPLVTKGKIIGGLLLYPREDGRDFSPSDERTIAIMACQVAMAIENARLLEAYQRGIEELAKINEMAMLLESRPNDPHFLSSLVQSLEGLFAFDICTFLLPSPRGGKVSIYAFQPLTDRLRAELKGKMIRDFCKRTQKKVESEDFEMVSFSPNPSPSTPPLTSLGSLLLLPLSAREQPLGIIGFARAKEEMFDQSTLKTINTISHLISLALENQQLYAGARDSYLSAVRALSATVEAKDPYAKDHSFYTAKYAKALAQKLGLPQAKVDEIIVASLLHDVGIIGISESILKKTERLSLEEDQKMQRHPAIGAKILESVNFPWDPKPLILSHHEHFDGTGYPSKLKGEEIPLGARILAIAEAYETMVANRPHRKAVSRSEAILRLLESKGTLFDPQLIPPFLEVLKEEG
jgi:putative nucleotidyltransferase with HDIG domain